MEQYTEIVAAVGGLGTVFGGWKLGAWLLDMRRAKLDAAKLENDAKRLSIQEDRQGDDGRSAALIIRMQAMIDDLKAEMATIKKEAAANLRSCEDREERLLIRIQRLEIFKGRASERIQVLQNYVRRLKGYDLPDFTEEPFEPGNSSTSHPVLPP